MKQRIVESKNGLSGSHQLQPNESHQLQQNESHQPRQKEPDIPFWRVVISVIQASFGVQNPANRERDFKQGRMLPFIVAALLFTGVFILTLVLIVNMVLGS